MIAEILPARLGGRIGAIPSKSDAHRLLICAALADSETELLCSGNAVPEDVQATVRCLSALGADILSDAAGVSVKPVRALDSESIVLDCGESGATLRFLLPVALALCSRLGVRPLLSFTGKEGLARRPVAPLCELLRGHGAEISADVLPFSARGGLVSGEYLIAGDISSQFLSGLLLALPMLAGESRVVLTTPLNSAGYVDMTLATLARFGIMIQREGQSFVIPGGQTYASPRRAAVEGDWSSAAPFLVAGAIASARGGVTVTGLNMESAQPDRRIVELLRGFGARVDIEGDAVTVRGSDANGALRGMDVDIGGCPDLLPVLAVLAQHAEGESVFTNAGRLRYKESDRLAACGGQIRMKVLKKRLCRARMDKSGSSCPALAAGTSGLADGYSAWKHGKKSLCRARMIDSEFTARRPSHRFAVAGSDRLIVHGRACPADGGPADGNSAWKYRKKRLCRARMIDSEFTARDVEDAVPYKNAKKCDNGDCKAPFELGSNASCGTNIRKRPPQARKCRPQDPQVRNGERKAPFELGTSASCGTNIRICRPQDQDHRVVMARAVEACCGNRAIVIPDAQAVNKSYPAFFEDLVSLGGKVHVL